MRRAFYCALLLVCSACAFPSTQPDLPLKEKPRLASHELIAADNAGLPVTAWLPAGRPRAVIVALHGFNDYSHAFSMPGEYLRRRGIAVYAYDQRGFGRAAHPGIWAGEGNLVRDAAYMVEAMKKRYPHVPVYLLGESMGGAVAVVALTHPGFPKVDGLILSAPAVWGGDTMNPLWRASLWLFAHTWPEKTLTGEDLHILASDNIPMLRQLSHDPLVIKKTRVDTIYGLVSLMDAAYERVGALRVPTLLLYGAHDQVIPSAPIAGALRKASDEDITTAYYPAGYHMLLRDIHRDVPLGDIASWVDDPDRPLPSGREKSAHALARILHKHKSSSLMVHGGFRAMPSSWINYD